MTKIALKIIAPQPFLVDEVVRAIVDDIVSGVFPPNSRLIQGELARAYRVSRHPVQQALLMLRNGGLVQDAPGRGLIVSALDANVVKKLYEVRAVLEGLAARLAAVHGRKSAAQEGPRYVEAGRIAVENRSLPQLMEADFAFHGFISKLSGNDLIGETINPHWPYVRRVMAEMLQENEAMPQRMWDDHADILAAIIEGNVDEAERLSREHLSRAATVFVERLQARQNASERLRQGLSSRRSRTAADL